MATLREYYESDFTYAAKLHVRVRINEQDFEAVVLFDFSGYSAFLAFYVPGQTHSLEYFISLVRGLEYGRTKLQLTGKVTLPSANQFPGALQVENKPDFEILARFFGDETWISSKSISSSKRVFIYSERELSESELLALREEGQTLGHEIQFRSQRHVQERSKFELPLAFISHDSRDKEAVARKIAINLQRMLCPVWYDEFSLRVGDPLRETIEKGLKECKKCILILSPRFLSNNGWRKKEFNSIFTREILHDQRLVLPVWYGVTADQVYGYSPSLLNVKGIDWNALGEQEVSRQLYHAIMVGPSADEML
jgi:hypothetical protein